MKWIDLTAPFKQRPRLPYAERGLVLTVGLPRSGKTSWAREQGFPIVNPDSIRIAIHGRPFVKFWEPLVWWIVDFMIYALFLAGHSYVIVDATNTTVMRRARFRSSQWKIYVHEIKTPEWECVQRADTTMQHYLIPIIRKMAATYEAPSTKEPGVHIWTR